jgi:hypothetical protein
MCAEHHVTEQPQRSGARLMKWCNPVVFSFFMFCVSVPAVCPAGDCFINKDSFAVSEPDMVTRVCYLWHHSRQYKPGSESEYTVASKETQHHDPLQAEFYKLLLDKKFITLARGTPVFGCGYDLKTITQDYPKAKLLGVALPQYNCFGRMSYFVSLRPVSSGTCYWVAVECVECREAVPDIVRQQKKKME